MPRPPPITKTGNVEEVVIGWKKGMDLGLSLRNAHAPPSSIPEPGVRVSRVTPGGCASQARLSVGDQITQVNGEKVFDKTAAQKLITGLLKRDSKCTLVVDRADVPKPSKSGSTRSLSCNSKKRRKAAFLVNPLMSDDVIMIAKGERERRRSTSNTALVPLIKRPTPPTTPPSNTSDSKLDPTQVSVGEMPFILESDDENTISDREDDDQDEESSDEEEDDVEKESEKEKKPVATVSTEVAAVVVPVKKSVSWTTLDGNPHVDVPIPRDTPVSKKLKKTRRRSNNVIERQRQAKLEGKK